MKKQLKSIIITVMLLSMIFSFNVFATEVSEAIILNDIADKKPGDQVTISGTTTLDGVTMRINRPNGTVLYIDILEKGSFLDTITLPEDTLTGTYTVIAGKGSVQVSKQFVVKNSSYQPKPNPTEPKIKEDESGNIKIEDDKSGNTKIVIPPNETNSNVELDIKIIQKAFDQSKQDQDGFKSINIEVPEVKQAKEYTVELPADVVSSNVVNQKITLDTPVGSVTIHNNMFESKDVKEQEKIALTIGAADKSSIDKETRGIIGNRPVININAEVGGKRVAWNNPHSPVAISINYKPTKEELKDPEHIVVWYIDGQGNIIPVPNGKYNPETGKVTFTTTHFSKYAVGFSKKTFNDIKNYPWAKKQIEVMASKGIINGTSTINYSPQENISRADFMCLLVRMLELTADVESNFNDLKSTDYYYESVGIAKKLGITTGVGNNKFNPKEHISRQDMMLMVTKALKTVGKISITGTAEDITGFSDAQKVSKYAVEGVATLIKEGIIQGNNNMINPQGMATRAEAALIIYRIYNK